MIFKRQILLYCLLFCSINVYAQPDTNVLLGSRDTLFVYDTLFVMDTIRILRTSKELENLEKLTPLEISYLDNSSYNKKISPHTATLFHPRINSLNNFKSKNKEMKKLGLLGLVFFAFQNMILAQHNVGVHVGGGIHNLVGVSGIYFSDPLENTTIKPTFQFGFSYRRLIAREKLFIDFGLTFSKLKPTRLSSNHLAVYDGNKKNHNLTSIPISLSLNSRFFQPMIGIEMYYKQVVTFVGMKEFEFHHSAFDNGLWLNDIGGAVILGFRLPITKRFSINSVFIRQLSPNQLFSVLSVASQPGKMQRIDITLRYQLLDLKKRK